MLVKRAEVQLPDPLYEQVEGLARELNSTIPELLRQAAEQLVQSRSRVQPKPDGDWRFPDGRHLGAFRAPVEDWRLLANEAAAE